MNIPLVFASPPLDIPVLDVTGMHLNVGTGVKGLSSLNLTVVVVVLPHLVEGLNPWGSGRRPPIHVASGPVERARSSQRVCSGSAWRRYGSPAAPTSRPGLMFSAGLALALQQVTWSRAARFVIWRGETFRLGGARVTVGAVSSGVIRLCFSKALNVGMGSSLGRRGGLRGLGQPLAIHETIGDRDQRRDLSAPVCHDPRDLPLLWDTIFIPMGYGASRARAEMVLRAAAQAKAVVDDTRAETAMKGMRACYPIAHVWLAVPEVFWRTTDDRLELSLHFLVEPRSIRADEDRVSHEILTELDTTGIAIASVTCDVVGSPPVTMVHDA